MNKKKTLAGMGQLLQCSEIQDIPYDGAFNDYFIILTCTNYIQFN